MRSDQPQKASGKAKKWAEVKADRATTSSERKRFLQIEADIAERQKNLTVTPKFEWEVQREERRALETQIATLRKALEKSERALAKARMTNKLVREKKVRVPIVDQILEIVDREPMTPGEVYEQISERTTCQYDSVRQMMCRLKRDGYLKRTEDGYIKVK